MSRTPEHVPVTFEQVLPKDRTTVLVSVHHSHKDDNPTSVSCNYDYQCTTAEQMFQRRLNITDDTVLDFGWITDPAWIIIVNKSKDQALVVNNTFEVLPGHHFDGRLLQNSQVSCKPLNAGASVDIQLSVTPR